jgi:hypothetical protein
MVINESETAINAMRAASTAAVWAAKQATVLVNLQDLQL